MRGPTSITCPDTPTPKLVKRWLLACYRYVDWGNIKSIGLLYKEYGQLISAELALGGALRFVLDVYTIGDYDAFIVSICSVTQQHGARVLDVKVSSDHPASRLRIKAHNMAVCSNHDYLYTKPPKISVELLVEPCKW